MPHFAEQGTQSGGSTFQMFENVLHKEQVGRGTFGAACDFAAF
jgi:hypothetical protein